VFEEVVMSFSRVNTSVLHLAYEAKGPIGGKPLFLLHGWPDDVRTYDRILPRLHEAGFRTIVPWLRGFGPTTFISEHTFRSGQIAAMVQDVLDLADALGFSRFAIVGHDWGARIGYMLAATFPERVTRLAGMSVTWQPGELPTPNLEQSQRYWYQWYMATERGANTLRSEGKAFARFMWETWSPSGWFDDATFDTTARSFENSDWAEITVHSYRVRWGQAEPDPRYAALEEHALHASSIEVPTLMIQGSADQAALASSSAMMGRYFSGPFQRVVLDGVGHFPTREAPHSVTRLLSAFLTGREIAESVRMDYAAE
jgi:pimeloyl-ACP methyl ester carboxylesterase